MSEIRAGLVEVTKAVRGHFIRGPEQKKKDERVKSRVYYDAKEARKEQQWPRHGTKVFPTGLGHLRPN